MTKKTQDDILRDLGLLRSRETSLQNGATREIAHLVALQGLIPAAERKIERAQEQLVSAQQELGRAARAVKTAEHAKGEALGGPVANRPERTVIEWRENQLSEARAKLKNADNAFGRTRCQHTVMEAERALDNAIGLAEGHDAAIAACEARMSLWKEAVDKTIPGDIVAAEEELQKLRAQITEQQARVTRAQAAVELTSEQIHDLEIEVCEPLISGAGGAS